MSFAVPMPPMPQHHRRRFLQEFGDAAQSMAETLSSQPQASDPSSSSSSSSPSSLTLLPEESTSRSGNNLSRGGDNPPGAGLGVAVFVLFFVAFLGITYFKRKEEMLRRQRSAGVAAANNAEPPPVLRPARPEPLTDEQKEAFLQHVQQQCIPTTMCVRYYDLDNSIDKLLGNHNNNNDTNNNSHDHRPDDQEAATNMANNNNINNNPHTPLNKGPITSASGPEIWYHEVWLPLTRHVMNLVPKPEDGTWVGHDTQWAWLRLTPGKPNGNRCVENSCAICLEQYEPNQHVTWCANARCPHAFHTDCFVPYAHTVIKDDKIFKTDGILCPLCRRPFIPPLPPQTATNSNSSSSNSSPGDTPTEV